MSTKFKDLIPELADLSVDIELITNNLIAIDEAYGNKICMIPPNATTLPCRMLQEKSQKLEELVGQFYKTMRENNGERL